MALISHQYFTTLKSLDTVILDTDNIHQSWLKETLSCKQWSKIQRISITFNLKALHSAFIQSAKFRI